jgi:hypothetical protein
MSKRYISIIHFIVATLLASFLTVPVMDAYGLITGNSRPPSEVNYLNAPVIMFREAFVAASYFPDGGIAALIPLAMVGIPFVVLFVLLMLAFRFPHRLARRRHPTAGGSPP